MKFALVILILALVAVLFLASRKPKSQRLSRQTTIKAPIGKVYRQIASLRAYNEWNPWAGNDPSQVVTFEGDDGALNSKMTWKGKKTGEGYMTLTEANGDNAVCYDLEFIKPFKGSSKARVTLVDLDGNTETAWHYDGQNSFIARIFAVFLDFEKMIGGQYDKGLAQLKTLCEA